MTGLLTLALGCTPGATTAPRADHRPPEPAPATSTPTVPDDEPTSTAREYWGPPRRQDPVGPPDPDPSAALFDDAVIPTFEIEVDEIGMDALRADPYRWVEGALVYDGVRYEPIGVRLKGENSFQPVDAKPSLKLDLNRYEDLDLLGLKAITLNNMDTDPSMVHERLAYRLYRELGIPAARCNHARVFLSGRDLGLYAHVETIDKTMIRRWHDDGGTMYEIFDVDFRPEFSPYDFDLEFGPSAIQAIVDATDALNDPDPDRALKQARGHVDIDEFIDFFAVSAVVGQFDAYPYSSPGDDAHVYLDPTTGLFRFLPHGVDETLSRPFRGVWDMNFGREGIVGEQCLLSDSCRTDLEARAIEVLDAMEAMDLHGYALDVMAQIAPLTVLDTAKPYTDDMVAIEQAVVLDFIANRRADF